MNLCRCGRELKLLNAGSDTPRCPACGFLPEWCRCEAVRLLTGIQVTEAEG